MSVAAILAGAVLALPACSAQPAAPAAPVRIVLDTDLGGDVDDVGALALLNHFEDEGRVRLLGVVASNPGAPLAPEAISAIDTSYGHGAIPIAVRDQAAPGERRINTSDYCRVLARFPRAADLRAHVAQSTAFYRRTLAAAPDRSVTILVTGGETDLARLLASAPDGTSPMPGADLVRAKVARLVVMGGRFPTGAPEWNLELDPVAAAAVAAHWPTDIVYSGWEVGARVRTGRGLATASAGDPVRAAYASYVGAGGTRPSWDQTAVLLAVRGADGLLTESEPGTVHVDPSGATRWTGGGGIGRRYVRLAAPASRLAAVIDAAMAAPPASGDR